MRMTSSPLMKPTASPRQRAARIPTMIGASKWPEMMATLIELAGTIDPTERSRWPAIISRPTGSAMMPSSEATLSQLAAPPADMKLAPRRSRKTPARQPCRSASPLRGAAPGRRSRVSKSERFSVQLLPEMIGQWLGISWNCPWLDGLDMERSARSCVRRRRDGECPALRSSLGPDIQVMQVSEPRRQPLPSSHRHWPRRRSQARSGPAWSGDRARS